MKILITTYVFHPTLGGIATASELLARELVAQGHEVRIVTTSEGEDPPDTPFRVFRRPGPLALWQQIVWCDVLLSVHISLRLAWPIFSLPRPWVIAHHSWLTDLDGAIGWMERLKRWVLRRATCISVSQAVADHVDTPSVVIGPPYNDLLFWRDPAILREKNLLFVGRLVSSKGLNVLLEALADLRSRGLTPGLTVVGGGPELARAKDLAKELGVADQVEFTGPRTGHALRETYCAHRILVVPSITPETFGIVALEGIACGCVVVGSEGAGGLTDAIGPCGVRVKMGDAGLLARELEKLLSSPEEQDKYRAHAAEHAQNFTAQRVTSQYLQVIDEAMATSRTAVRIHPAL